LEVGLVDQQTPSKLTSVPSSASGHRATFFPSADAFREWLATNHSTAKEIEVGIYRKGTGKGGLSYVEAVEIALCFGWIDGVLHKIDDKSFRQRFTPRRPGSAWSNVNVDRVKRLMAEGRMHEAGLKAFSARSRTKTGIYSFEKKPEKLPRALEKEFRLNGKAWSFFRAQAPSYQRLSIHRLVEAKQESTRLRRLARLIEASAAGRRLL
jgi:uncharacterized protein YdeI (YjbR/CyaY-like superfamily)